MAAVERGNRKEVEDEKRQVDLNCRDAEEDDGLNGGVDTLTSWPLRVYMTISRPWGTAWITTRRMSVAAMARTRFDERAGEGGEVVVAAVFW